MSKLAWLTPEEAPLAAKCRTVYIPDSLLAEAAFWGAFLLLTDSANWEAHGAQTPDAIAGAFLDAFFLSQDHFGDCEGVKLIGEIFLYAGSGSIAGCLACDGASYLRADFPALFTAIGVVYGSADADHFNVPDIRGRLPVGAGQGTGLTARALGGLFGVENVTLQENQMPAHLHAYGWRISTIVGSLGSGTPLYGFWRGDVSEVTGEAGGDQPHTNMPPILGLNYYIQAL